MASDDLVIEAKLTSLRRCVTRLEEKRPGTLEALEADIDLQDILAVNLERAVQLCVDIALHLIAASDQSAPPTMGEAFRTLHRMEVLGSETAEALVKAVGFRNVAVHLYQEIDLAIVFDVVTNRLGVFREFTRSILER